MKLSINKTWLYWLSLFLVIWAVSPVDARFRDTINFEDNEFIGMKDAEILHRYQSFEGMEPSGFDRTQLLYQMTYGIFTNYELSLKVPVLFFDNGDQGVGDISILQRVKFSEEEMNGIDSSGGLELILPTGDEDQNTGTDKFNIRLFGDIGGSFYRDWYWLANLGYTMFGDNNIDDRFEYNAAVRYQLSEGIKFNTELNGHAGGQPDNSELYIAPGMLFQPRKGLTVTLSIPIGVTSDAADHLTNLQLLHEF